MIQLLIAFIILLNSIAFADPSPATITEIKRELESRSVEFSVCYHKAKHKLLNKTFGKVVFKIEISPDGKVISVSTAEDHLMNSKVTNCSYKIFQKTHFEIQEKETFFIHYPIEFRLEKTTTPSGNTSLQIDRKVKPQNQNQTPE